MFLKRRDETGIGNFQDTGIEDRRRWKLEPEARISRHVFEILIGVLFGLALVAAVFRSIFRLRTMRKLSLDDYFVALGISFLIAETGILYHFTDSLYFISAAYHDPTAVGLLDAAKTRSLLNDTKYFHIFFGLSWSATFAIKFSFLAFFRRLVTDVSKPLILYYWFCVVFTGVTWVFLVVEPFILCPFFGTESMKCFTNVPFGLNFSLTTVVTILDIVTDVLIVSIPLIILSMSGLKSGQKFGVCVFRCLSIIMVVVALVRLLGAMKPSIPSARYFDLVWETFWQHIEGCVAVFMGSVTSFRTVFKNHRALLQQEQNPAPKRDSHFSRFFRRIRISRSERRQDTTFSFVAKPKERMLNASIAHATLTGVRTFIRRYRRDPTDSSISMVQESNYDPWEDYHNFQREQGRSPRDEDMMEKAYGHERYDSIEVIKVKSHTHSESLDGASVKSDQR